MTKSECVSACRRLLKDGYYTRPAKPFWDWMEWEIIILHDFKALDYEYLRHEYDLTFLDCIYYTSTERSREDYPVLDRIDSDTRRIKWIN